MLHVPEVRMTPVRWMLACAAFTLAGCQPAEPELDGGPSGAEGGLAGEPAQAEADGPCSLFTALEIGGFLGKAVGEGEPAAAGTSCRWRAADGVGEALVQLLPADRFSRPTAIEGFEDAPQVSPTAYVVRELDGHAAGAMDGEDGAIVVTLAGPVDTRSRALDLLTDALERNGD
jgi:hypothetical protein